ncbi:hypothetical protein AKJ29_16065 [Aliiroseovarius crassostreae]|uniref:DUF1127 domain-containing protein n=2 Tax=Aliiroseovarius crassostreae TaxID=154981 RepID=A0A0P7KPA8_9RHOB|nr:hypothetical protein AKJ29_16065 [Aliiroseovarius crassostreae]
MIRFKKGVEKMTAFVQTHTCPSTSDRKGFFSALRWMTHALQIRRERQLLSEMSATRLEDIGVTRDQALNEAQKPIWDVPAHWVC